MLSDTLRTAAERFGDRIAWVSPTGLKLSYGQADRLADEVAAGLVARGLRPGDVLGLILPPSAEYLVSYLAAARLGAITAGVNHRLTPSEQQKLLDLADPSLVLDTQPQSSLSRVGSGSRTLPSVLQVDPAKSIDGFLTELRGVPVGAGIHYSADRAVAIVFTSGTTGTPRGAVFCGRQLEFITSIDTGNVWSDPLEPALHTLSGMSLTHLGPMTKLPGNLMRGSTTHLLERWSPLTALELTQRHEMPVLAGVPTQIALMLHHDRFGDFDLSCVQAVIMGGGPASPGLISEARDRLGVPVMIRYSCTEAGTGVGTEPTDRPEETPGTVGRPHEGVELTIRSSAGELLPDGAEGEVCLKSPAVMSAYWRDPDATALAFTADGAVRTGDSGRLVNGSLVLVGRSRDMFVRGGNNVHPGEVEAVLEKHPGVRQVAVIAQADETMGEIGVAVVIPASEIPPTLEDLREFAGAELAAYKLPERLVLTKELPLTPMDKLDRPAVAALAEERPGKSGSETEPNE